MVLLFCKVLHLT